MGRAPKGREGTYMAAYTMAFSLAHILSAKTGMTIISKWGYNANWLFMGTFGLLGVGALILMQKLLAEENK